MQKQVDIDRLNIKKENHTFMYAKYVAHMNCNNYYKITR